MPQTPVMTFGDAERLAEEKMERLRTDAGLAERQGQRAVEQRDKALHEVTTLQREKSSLIEELAKVKKERQLILDSLAEHRKNVEASLATQEASATTKIEQAADERALLDAHAHAIRQYAGQVLGVKHTLLAEIHTLLTTLTTVLSGMETTLTQLQNPTLPTNHRT